MVVVWHVFVEAASERARVRCRGTHTRFLLAGDGTVIFGYDLVGNGAVGGYGAWMDGKANGRRKRGGTV